MTKHLLLLCALAGCEKNLLTPDASLDAPGTMATSCPAVTATPLPAGHYKLFVNTEGANITHCTADNAPTNCSELAQGNATIPQFLPADPNRQSFIDAIVASVQSKLAPYSIDVVTTRPGSGDYYMAVLGGDVTLVAPGAPAGVMTLAPGVCDFGNRDRVTFEFDRGSTATDRDYAQAILTDFGSALGLAVTTDPGDCLCKSDGCGPALDPEICTFGAAATVSTIFSCGRTVQDEPMLLAEALGCR